MKQFKGPIFLFLAAIFWGVCFSAQSAAMQHVSPMTFVFMRSLLTCIMLLVFMKPLCALAGESAPKNFPLHLRYGALIGLFLCVASTLQQIGIQTTTTAKSGFITALYLIIVPMLGIFFKRRPSPGVFGAAALSLVGMFFLCKTDESLNLCIGDFYTLLCALLFSFHILTIDRFGGQLNSILLSAVQFGTTALLCGIFMLLFEKPTLDGIRAAMPAILYAAIFSGTLGFTFQIIGQKYTDPTLASLLMCLESVFSAFGGWLILDERLTLVQLSGCALMLCASCIALLSQRKHGLN